LVLEAIDERGYGGEISLALDAAASGFRDGEGYSIGGKWLTPGELQDLYADLVSSYPILSLEDPFDESDWDSFRAMTERLGGRIRVIGDDLFVSNPALLSRGIEEGTANAILLKVNQIGTVSEALESVTLAYGANFDVMVSHRSGETCDDFIADLAVGTGCGMIKAGAPCRSERTAKYNRLLRIAEAGLPYGLRDKA
ncbi:MAG: phosphopyruvate hydratase, partial [Thermoplasmata archaeon]|nr:phosphopyruvate hydratase [Thermoplasmata archaeon]